jgi:hypothetical protein
MKHFSFYGELSKIQYYKKMYIGLQAKHPFFLSDLNEKSLKLYKICSNSMKIRPQEAELLHADRLTGRHNTIVIYLNSMKAPKSWLNADVHLYGTTTNNKTQTNGALRQAFS